MFNGQVLHFTEEGWTEQTTTTQWERTVGHYYLKISFAVRGDEPVGYEWEVRRRGVRVGNGKATLFAQAIDEINAFLAEFAHRQHCAVPTCSAMAEIEISGRGYCTRHAALDEQTVWNSLVELYAEATKAIIVYGMLDVLTDRQRVGKAAAQHFHETVSGHIRDFVLSSGISEQIATALSDVKVSAYAPALLDLLNSESRRTMHDFYLETRDAT